MKGEPISLLLIEDDDVEAENVIRSLNKAKIANNVIRARNGLEGLAILRGDSPEHKVPHPVLVLLDINMPRMNGLEFLTEVRSDEELQKLIIFVLTTSDDDRDRAAAYDANVAGYIVKSSAGKDFLNLLDLIESYWRIVEFPAITES